MSLHVPRLFVGETSRRSTHPVPPRSPVPVNISHTGRKGEGPAVRITDAGYRWARWAENIAAGQRTPTAVVDAMHSPVHRADILDCSLREIGIGYSVDSAKKAYWTQDFGTPWT
ncbi:CAP domain-containing protein [Amycolatopsis sp. cmx-8-4]|uniref:CAP domain-containing protein n=1 Tax=Amycolatopsis sp. cmx-8-4 TaxID=2790947 RepID=UPI0039784300